MVLLKTATLFLHSGAGKSVVCALKVCPQVQDILLRNTEFSLCYKVAGNLGVLESIQNFSKNTHSIGSSSSFT